VFEETAMGLMLTPLFQGKPHMKFRRNAASQKQKKTGLKSPIEWLEDRRMLSGAPDLSMTYTGPSTIVAGTDATYVFTTTNLGKGTANPITYTPPVGYPSGCSQVTFALTSGPAALKAGQTQTYTLVLAVNAYVQSATVLQFPIEVTTPHDSATANNTVTINTAVTASADLNLVVNGPAEVTAGTEATWTFSTVNAGPSTETTGLYTPPSGFPDGLTQISYTLVSGPGFALAPGDQDVYALVMSVPSTVPNGTVVSFPAVLTGGVPDPNPANNSATVSTTVVTQVVQPVSIALTSSTFNQTSTLGEGVSFTAVVSPLGGSSAVPTGTVTFTSDGTTLGTETLDSTGTASLPATTALTGGYHTIIASYSGDSTYTATTKSLTQVVTTPTPSTVIPVFGKISLPTAVVAGAKFKASLPVGLTNNGAKQSGIFKVTLYADTNDTLDGNQVQVGTPIEEHLALATDKHAAVAFHLTSLPATLPQGTYYILAEVTDALTLNNVVVAPQTITSSAPFVKLTATTTPVLPASIAVNKSGSITVSVTNSGNVAATGPLTITLAPSGDGVSPIPGVFFQTLSVAKTSIGVGKTAKYTLHIKNASAVAAGTFYPYVTVSLDGITTSAVSQTEFTLV